MMSSEGGRSSHSFKVVLLGEGCVGKTSLVLRYVEDKFNEQHVSTLQASFLVKKLNIGGRRIKLSIWDTAGQEKFHALGPIYYRDSNGGILVYDVTDQDSFHKVKKWVKELRKMLGEGVSLCIAGNKIDLEKDRCVSEEEAKEFANSVGATHIYTSAKMNKGVEDLFLQLSTAMIEYADRVAARSPNSPSRNILSIADENQPASNHRSGCCS